MVLNLHVEAQVGLLTLLVADPSRGSGRLKSSMPQGYKVTAEQS